MQLGNRSDMGYLSMKIAIMQPYFMPYLGYWQLMNAVDQYIIYDDVNYIRGGWINRNRILINDQVRYFNIPVLGGSQNKKINEIMMDNNEALIKKRLQTLEFAYKRAPYYNDVYPLMKEILLCGEKNLSKYLLNSFFVLSKYLDMTTKFVISSTIEKDNSLKGQDKILSICRALKATEYYNAIGGRELYSFEAFRQKGICLKFLKSQDIRYKQYNGIFHEDLSIVDVLMFNSQESVKEMLNCYMLLAEE